jgi:hypothetical protein
VAALSARVQVSTDPQILAQLVAAENQPPQRSHPSLPPPTSDIVASDLGLPPPPPLPPSLPQPEPEPEPPAGGGVAKLKKSQSFVSDTDPTAKLLLGSIDYNHMDQLSSSDMQRETQWKVLPRGSFDPDECDVVTLVPFGTGPVVELRCNGTVHGVGR